MSCRKGDQRKRGQKHQNATAYKSGRYGETRQAKLAAALPLAGLCARCKEKIEWKKKYDKYKPLTAPRKCVLCEGKKVRQAYYRLCQDCAQDKRVCAKCGEAAEILERWAELAGKHQPRPLHSFPMSASAQAKEEAEFRHGLKMLTERERRKLLREQQKGRTEPPQPSMQEDSVPEDSDMSDDDTTETDSDPVNTEPPLPS